MDTDRIEQLDPATCWALLRTTTVGRLAVATDRGADIFPVNYVVDDGTVVFRTAAGSKLVAALGTETVAVEADGVDGARQGASAMVWSVVLRGRATEIGGLQATLDTFELPLFPWHDSPKNCFVRITPGDVTGRRFRAAEPAHWTHFLSGAPHSSPE
ncbi:Nitroimidazol reductase NimA, pyridoxamine 5'-phosphate oxidase superfamily [Jatrophihabitans endophyticus]|uniref:Nitroimidazol reductase NimA, pyridoxamine 5'-phosphate oxidase superfamily n=1 Tax=Jatrophihabitans endophyticus TaxID=1206085 RepID=A0A1M5S491_9ACTN|nr:pyridoxamine 5'-phosphate oxidase family protein [Jatrophihabitans endophyticus]SHH33407.1 Nitroimidazol reductase NimA, pyridoxamine 5'-phosphate oxidase superfamily [Jatrophihabitans endophyticus]